MRGGAVLDLDWLGAWRIGSLRMIRIRVPQVESTWATLPVNSAQITCRRDARVVCVAGPRPLKPSTAQPRYSSPSEWFGLEAAARACTRRHNRLCPGQRKISYQPVEIAPQLSCLPPTSVGGSRPTTMFLEPASTGLLEEFESPAEAGCDPLPGLPNHQLKLVANRNSGL